MAHFSEEILWKSIKHHIDRNMELMDVSFEKGYILFSFDNPDFPGGKSNTSAHIREDTTTLGIDVMGYSGKDIAEQFLTSVKLFAFIEKTIAWFEKEAPGASCRPDSIIPTGDGALLFFSEGVNSIVRAINFVIYFNMHIDATNIDVPLIGATYNGLRIPTRYTIASGNAILIKDPNGNVNAVGESIIRCARVLSCDKGTHFLIEQNAANILIKNNGTICKGIENYAEQIYSKISCSVSDKLVNIVKKKPFEFYNVYCEYDVLALMDSKQKEREKTGINYIFKLGDKNLKGIETNSISTDNKTKIK